MNFYGETKDGRLLITYERGVDDFTGSCGTGAVCTAAELFEQGAETNILFQTPGGNIEIEYSGGHYRIRGGIKKL